MPSNIVLARAIEAAHRAGPAESATVNHLLLAAPRGDALLACNWWPPMKVAGYHKMNRSLQLCQPSAFLGKPARRRPRTYSTSAVGTEETCQPSPTMSAIGGWNGSDLLVVSLTDFDPKRPCRRARNKRSALRRT